MMKKLLEFLFFILYYLGLMKLADFLMITFLDSIGWMNILTIPLAFVALILSTWLSERTVMLIRKYL